MIKGNVMSGVKSFEIVTSANTGKANLMSGHATVVQRMKALTGDIVVKEHKETAGSETDVDWLKKQKKAQKIADEIRAKNNPLYFVPKTFISHGKVREEFVTGQRWRNIIKTLSPQDKEWAYKALAEFINDMSELRPIKYDNNIRSVSRLPIKGIKELSSILDTWDEKYVSVEDKQLIKDIYEYLSSIPENKLMVFGHNDLHGDNIIIDLNKRQISIIDFEMTGYKSAYDVMYNGITDFEELWEYINKLPRSTNPNLVWEFVSEHRKLHQFLVWGYYDLFVCGTTLEQMSKEIKQQCKRIRPIFASAKLKRKRILEKQKMPLVLSSHYGRD